MKEFEFEVLMDGVSDSAIKLLKEKEWSFNGESIVSLPTQEKVNTPPSVVLYHSLAHWLKEQGESPFDIYKVIESKYPQGWVAFPSVVFEKNSNKFQPAWESTEIKSKEKHEFGFQILNTAVAFLSCAYGDKVKEPSSNTEYGWLLAKKILNVVAKKSKVENPTLEIKEVSKDYNLN